MLAVVSATLGLDAWWAGGGASKARVSSPSASSAPSSSVAASTNGAGRTGLGRCTGRGSAEIVAYGGVSVSGTSVGSALRCMKLWSICIMHCIMSVPAWFPRCDAACKTPEPPTARRRDDDRIGIDEVKASSWVESNGAGVGFDEGNAAA